MYWGCANRRPNGGETVIAWIGATHRSRRSGPRRAAAGHRHPAPSPADDQTALAPPDRQRQRARSCSLSPELLAPGNVRSRLDRPVRVGSTARPPTVRILGARSLAASVGAPPAAPLAHAAG